MTILDEILDHKRGEVEGAKARRDPESLARAAQACAEPTRGFRSALDGAEGISVIAEVKRQSPSKGIIRADFDPIAIARAYADAGAACISVLTDERFFGGALEYLTEIREAVPTPLLRKDFVIDAYQIDEARVAGADAILLIVAALDPAQLAALQTHARALDLDVLVEVHDEEELEVALSIGADLVGVNNRNLKTFEVDLAHTERIAARLADDAARGKPPSQSALLVAESGIGSHADVERLERAGASAFLVGESLMRQPDPGKALEALLWGEDRVREKGRST